MVLLVTANMLRIEEPVTALKTVSLALIVSGVIG